MNNFTVLMYHEIIKKEDFKEGNNSRLLVGNGYNDILPQPLFVFLHEFEMQMKYLYENNYSIITLKDVIDFYYNNKPLKEKSVLITFDDMYKSSFIYAYSILKKYNFSAVGFVVLDWIFERAEEYDPLRSVCVSKEELQSMRDVFTYANHTKTLHKRENGITDLQKADKDTFIEDIRKCEEFIEEKKVFAYPFGIFKEEIVDWLQEESFLLGFTTEPGINTREQNPLKLKRNMVALNCNMESFKNILHLTGVNN
ncbi:polysaccharide deacetylase family protein [Clostridium sp.]|uniref:polysaccharide deacetylase family protein n=1 Tax=Clostridium sp. TaxID=1506 RepID=UPI0034639778